jgi:hypothetical protein
MNEEIVTKFHKVVNETEFTISITPSLRMNQRGFYQGGQMSL